MESLFDLYFGFLGVLLTLWLIGWFVSWLPWCVLSFAIYLSHTQEWSVIMDITSSEWFIIGNIPLIHHQSIQKVLPNPFLTNCQDFYLRHRRWTDFIFIPVCLSVCLWARYLKRLWTDSDETWWTGLVADINEMITFWWRSASGYSGFLKWLFTIERYRAKNDI